MWPMIYVIIRVAGIECILSLFPSLSPILFLKGACPSYKWAYTYYNLGINIVDDKVLNKNIRPDKERNEKETKTLPHVYCIMSCCPHFSLETNRYGAAVNSASSIHIYHFSKGCSREDVDQYEFIFSGNGKYLNCSVIRCQRGLLGHLCFFPLPWQFQAHVNLQLHIHSWQVC